MQLQIEGAREITQGGASRVQCHRARYTFWYENGTQVCASHGERTTAWWLTNAKSIWTGNLNVSFAPYMGPNEDVKFQTLEFEIHKTEEYIARVELQKALSQGSPMMNKSPKMSRTPGKNKAAKMQQEPITMESFPSAPVNEFGVTSAVMQFFEVMQGTNMSLKNHGD